MRLFLDAHLSSRRIGDPLRRDGHDVLAIADQRELDGMIDPQVMEMAAQERRILVTGNAKHFSPILRTWAEAGLHHSGCILLWGFRSEDFGQILRVVRGALVAYPSAAQWRDLIFAPHRD